jgi:hypothetical protein
MEALAADAVGDRECPWFPVLPLDQLHLPHWQLWPEGFLPSASASLHHAHFDLPALVHAHAIVFLQRC